MAGPNALSLSFCTALLHATLVSSASIYTPRDGNSQQSEQSPTVTSADTSDPVSGIGAAAPQSTQPSKQIIHGMSNSSAVALIVFIGAVVLLVPMFGFIFIRRQKLRRAARIKRMKSRIELAHRRRKESAGSVESELESPKEESKVTGLGIQKPLPAVTAKALPPVHAKEIGEIGS